MKRQVRLGVFETNSSSTHSLTMCTEEEYKRWENGEILFDVFRKEFITEEEAIEKLKTHYGDDGISGIDLNDGGYFNLEEYSDDEYLETFEETYTTPNGEKVVAFGKFGYDN